MADIVKRLRMEAAQCDLSPCDCQCPNLIEAADEIQRLRAELDAEGNDTNLLMLEIKRLCAAGDALLAAISVLSIEKFSEGLAVINAMNDWERARYG